MSQSAAALMNRPLDTLTAAEFQARVTYAKAAAEEAIKRDKWFNLLHFGAHYALVAALFVTGVVFAATIGTKAVTEISFMLSLFVALYTANIQGPALRRSREAATKARQMAEHGHITTL